MCGGQVILGEREVRVAARETEPHVGLNIVLWNTETVHVQQPQLVPTLTRSTKVLGVFCGLSVPFDG